jgi:hypothetical protein
MPFLPPFDQTKGGFFSLAGLLSAGSRKIIGKQKSSWLSRCVRFVIADHSPQRVLETGLLLKAPEKNPCNESEVARRSFSLVRFA